LLIVLAGDVAINPGPLSCSSPPHQPSTSIPAYLDPGDAANPHNIECLYLNYTRSLANKTSELQTLVTCIDLPAVTETWLKSEIGDCELLPGNDFTILSLRRKDLESNAEMVVCEIRLDSRKKLLVIVFYRPPDTDMNYIKEFKKSLQSIQNSNKFDQLLFCGDFNLPHTY
jgi:hypothetical protein